MFQGSKIQSEVWEELLVYCNDDKEKALKMWNDASRKAYKESKKDSKVLVIKARQFGIAARIHLENKLMEVMDIK